MIEVGDYVEFGRWFHNSNGKVDDIEWRVLSIVDGVAFLVSRFGLDARRFDCKTNEWENSEIRQWLNGEFKKMAFFDEELMALDGEISLLSYQEVKDLMPNGYFARKCFPTPWAKARGAFVDGKKCVWWTRTISDRFRRIVYAVSLDGGIRMEDCCLEMICVRPCVRVKVEALRGDDDEI